MKRSRFSEAQIIGILKEADSGLKVCNVCRKHGISDATYYKWKSKFGGLEISLKTLTDRIFTYEDVRTAGFAGEPPISNSSRMAVARVFRV